MENAYMNSDNQNQESKQELIADDFEISYLLKKRDDKKARIQKLKDEVALENAKRGSVEMGRASRFHPPMA